MPKITCKCGNVINTGGVPNPSEMKLISDIDFDKYCEDNTMDTMRMCQEMTSVVACHKCHRLHIFWDGLSNAPTVYLKE